MGKKKACYGSDAHVCMVKDCAYMSECIRIVWEKKMDKVLSRARNRRATREGSTQRRGSRSKA